MNKKMNTSNRLHVNKVCVLVLFSLILLVSGVIHADQGQGDPQIDAVVEKALRAHDVPGASVAVMKNGELSWAKGYGLADPAQNLPVTPATSFESASISKAITAWGIMKLVEDGLLDLDAPIDQYVTRWQLPPSDYDHSEVTIRRILSHTAGLSQAGDPGIKPGEYVPTLEEALSGAVFGMPALYVAFPPGEDYHYSSIGYTLLELAVEEVTGEPFAVYMQREILEPLGMTRSYYDWTPELRVNAAVGHDWYNNPLPEYQRSTKALGGLVTTASDLTLFMAASIEGPNGEPIGRGVLTPESVSEVLTPVSFVKAAESMHVTGLGYDLIVVDGTQVGARKTGDNFGWKSMIVMVPEQGDGIAIMANSDRALVGFLIDIACAWSASIDTHPLKNDCNVLFKIRNVQITVGAVFALLGLVYLAWVANGFRTAHRQVNWNLTLFRIVRVTLLTIILIVWWLLWHTDILFFRILHKFPESAVTVRLLVPWPTAFVWISRGLTLLLLVSITATFAPRVKAHRESTRTKD